MDNLDISSDKNKEKVDMIDHETRINLLENKVVLVTNKDSKIDKLEFKDLIREDIKKIALGNLDVPVGQYSEELLKNIGIYDKIQNKVTLGSNVKEVTTWVKENTVDVGIVYKTDAKASNLIVLDEANDKILKSKVVYPMAMLKNAGNKELQKKFMDYLISEEGKKIFVNSGFTPLK